MSVNKLSYLSHLRVFLSFLRIIQGFDCPGKYISQPTRIIGSLLYSKNTFQLCAPKLGRRRRRRAHPSVRGRNNRPWDSYDGKRCRRTKVEDEGERYEDNGGEE
jgi:hypothetical protein